MQALPTRRSRKIQGNPPAVQAHTRGDRPAAPRDIQDGLQLGAWPGGYPLRSLQAAAGPAALRTATPSLEGLDYPRGYPVVAGGAGIRGGVPGLSLADLCHGEVLGRAIESAKGGPAGERVSAAGWDGQAVSTARQSLSRQDRPAPAKIAPPFPAQLAAQAALSPVGEGGQDNRAAKRLQKPVPGSYVIPGKSLTGETNHNPETPQSSSGLEACFTPLKTVPHGKPRFGGCFGRSSCIN